MPAKVKAAVVKVVMAEFADPRVRRAVNGALVAAVAVAVPVVRHALGV